MKDENRTGKTDYAEMREITRRVIHEWDPYSLLEMGAPEDEFDYEISKITANICRIETPEDAVGVVSCVFSEAFGESDFSPAKCEKAGTTLFARLSASGLLAG